MHPKTTKENMESKNLEKKMEHQLVELRTALNQAIDEEMTLDDSVCLMGEEVANYNGAYKISKGLLDKWGPTRIIDTPIAELGFSGLAIGAAMTGLRPIVEFMSWNFSFVAFDQLVSNAAKMHYMSGGRFSVPVVFRGANGPAAQVSCQHSHAVEALYSNFPGLIVIYPSNPYDAKGLLKSAIRNNNPIVFLESELDYNIKQEIPINEYTVPIGKASVINEGEDITLISYGHLTNVCKPVVEQLKKEKINVDHIDLRTIKPLDKATIFESIKKTNRCVIVEEGHSFAGVSAEISFLIMNSCFDYLDAPIERVCQRETPLPYSKAIEGESIPNAGRIMKAIRKTLK